jgi:hypothetical protein
MNHQGYLSSTPWRGLGPFARAYIAKYYGRTNREFTHCCRQTGAWVTEAVRRQLR